MANKNAHMTLGAVAGLIVYALQKKLAKEEWSLSGLLACMATGAVVAVLPDIIEPALHPNHRSFFHSLAAGGLIVGAARTINNSPDIPQHVKKSATLCCAAYVSHLILDSTTPKGLPLLKSGC